MRQLETIQLRIKHVLNLLDILGQIMAVPFDTFFFQWELFSVLRYANLALHLLQQRALSLD